jgi:hypothetical protein
MKPSFFSSTNIKRNIFDHINFKVLGLMLLVYAIGAFIVVFLLNMENSEFANFGVSLFLFAIGYYMLKTKIKYNNYCPKCHSNHCFYADINTKTTHYNSSTSEVIYERNSGKRIGYYQKGTSVDGAKYDIRTETSTTKSNSYDWLCSNCSFKANLEESQSGLFYILMVLFSFGGIVYYGYKSIGEELYDEYKQKQQDKEIELLLEKKSSSDQNNQPMASDTTSYQDANEIPTSGFNEADYSARYTIGPLQKVKAKFVGYEEGDLVHYIFEDEVGNSYEFSVIPNTYQLVVNNSTSEYGVAPNNKYLNKTFALSWKHLEPKYNEEMEYPFQVVLNIELLQD